MNKEEVIKFTDYITKNYGQSRFGATSKWRHSFRDEDVEFTLEEIYDQYELHNRLSGNLVLKDNNVFTRWRNLNFNEIEDSIWEGNYYRPITTDELYERFVEESNELVMTSHPHNILQFSYYGEEVVSSPNELIRLFGSPFNSNNTGNKSCNFEWSLRAMGTGLNFCIYDYLVGHPISPDHVWSFHIGSIDKKSSLRAKNLIEMIFDKNQPPPF